MASERSTTANASRREKSGLSITVFGEPSQEAPASPTLRLRER